MVLNGKSPSQMDDLGVPLLLETTIYSKYTNNIDSRVIDLHIL